MRNSVIQVCLISLTCLSWSGPVRAAESQASASYLGAASCASSACHGSTQGFSGSKISHDEYLIWQRRDRHSRAYLTLLSPASQAIAAALGTGPAHEDPQCLACHASAGLAAEQGPRFQIRDGVDCETCHGPASDWIHTHTEGLKQESQRLEHGLHPTWAPAARAQLCVSCHVGDRERPISHAVMAAGHPPLNFELDTYLAVMPPHHRVEKAQVLGKPEVTPLEHWRVGQGAAAQALLARVEDLTESPSVLPDFGLFDCYACHHDLQLSRWERGRAPGLQVGELRLADSALMSLQLWLDAANSEWAKDWTEARANLNGSLNRGRPEELLKHRQKLLDLYARIPWEVTASGEDLDQIGRLIRLAGTRYRSDFALAQQAAMLAGVLAEHLSGAGRPAGEELGAALEALRSTVSDSLAFEPDRYANANYRFRMLAQPLIDN